ncbi:Uncharacterized protein BP5553_03451 [Venustampulla echinocandica]|uniref:Uncharacterized protein n=1 Tax=Venustampulla echinocandica TaxID=2656787 RepID=A0A370TUA6_9HELO|nr:Uncharacterized protein BP5553_03451 [Venustampulla echinocandica]RDL39111.1 Uncharacterized protein BP5553_03451 [Venustampulla echinocandica]
MDNRRAESPPRLGPRIPMGRIGVMGPVMDIAVPSHVLEPRDSSSTDSASASADTCGANPCQKPVGPSTFTLPIALGVIIPVVGALIVFIILHRRHVRRQREEDTNDQHASMDFGLGDVPQPGRPKKKAPMSEMDFAEKEARRPHQLSMDMSLNSPYLLPPELQDSRESLHSLSRTIHQNEDPYRPVTQQYSGDGSSIRSQKQGSSIYTSSSSAPSKLHEVSTAELLANAASMPKSIPATAFIPPPRQNSLPQSHSKPNAFEPTPPVPPYPSEPEQAHLPQPSSPETTRNNGLPSSPRPGPGLALPLSSAEDSRDSFVSNGHASLRRSNNYLGAFITEQDAPLSDAFAREEDNHPVVAERKPVPNSLPTNPRPTRKESVPANQYPDEGSEYGDGFKVTPPSPGRDNAEMMRGQRYSMDVPPEEFAQAGLGAPGFDSKRLSMGFRPLPPDHVTETDDPEVRANRIRSFYKEYFDESKPTPEGQYYEDYDEGYLGEAAYYHPDTNGFAMPYAEPVTRRAMTPPPRAPPGPRFQGPPRAMHGSMGAVSFQGRPPPGPRAYSSASGRMGPPRAKKPMPPPAALNTIPTPSKLRDDSFALMGSIDFAPPTSMRERTQGRSQSPFGERRPYSPVVPAFTPVASAFEELAPMPSPHLLRKSGTFTALDFAPPKKFRDPDTMSDSGSIRSNRSGISQVQNQAIRDGAYRVSRIPKGVVFTKDDMSTTLKPQWGMRADN